MNALAESLLKCRVEGNIVYLPSMSEGPLENYQDVRKALLNAGATYKRNTFVFPDEAQPYIDRIVSGESVNIKKEFQFFPTPKDIAEMMISYLPPVAQNAKVLEPSAGDQEQLTETLPVEEIKTEKEAKVAEETPTITSEPIPDAYQEYLKNRNSSSITFTEMKFFEQLEKMGPGVDLTLRIKEKNGKYTVGVTPEVANKSKIKPLNVTGTAAELDAGFFPGVGPIIYETHMIIQNAEEHKKSVADLVQKDDKKPAARNSSSTSQPAKKSVPKKAAKRDEPKSQTVMF